MVVFDVLDNLETYSSVIPHMDDVVYVMDHSKPYDDSVGEYGSAIDRFLFKDAFLDRGFSEARFSFTLGVGYAFGGYSG